MIWKVVDRQRRAIALYCLPWPGEERFRGRTPAAHRLGDPLTLKRIDQTGGVADEKYPSFGGNGANHAHLEPTTQATRWHRKRRVGEELDLTQVLEEERQGLLDLRSRLTIGHRTQTQADICSPGGSWKDPPITGKPVPRRRFPKHDGGEIDGLWKVCPYRETPQDLLCIDHAGCLRHPARRAVGSNHEVGAQLGPVTQPVAVNSPLAFHRPDGMSVYRNGSRFDRHLVEHRVKDGTCNRRAMTGVGEPFAAGELRPATVLADDQDVADVLPRRSVDLEIGQQTERPRADDIATGFVTRELCLVDQCHPGSAPGENECGDAARWAATYNEDVKAR